MNAAGHSAAAPNESDFSIKDHLYLKMATRREYKSVGRQFRRQQSGGWGGWGGGTGVWQSRKRKSTIYITLKSTLQSYKG